MGQAGARGVIMRREACLIFQAALVPQELEIVDHKQTPGLPLEVRVGEVVGAEREAWVSEESVEPGIMAECFKQVGAERAQAQRKRRLETRAARRRLPAQQSEPPGDAGLLLPPERRAASRNSVRWAACGKTAAGAEKLALSSLKAGTTAVSCEKSVIENIAGVPARTPAQRRTDSWERTEPSRGRPDMRQVCLCPVVT